MLTGVDLGIGTAWPPDPGAGMLIVGLRFSGLPVVGGVESLAILVTYYVLL
jgi:hypothetical protein